MIALASEEVAIRTLFDHDVLKHLTHITER
jgi:hypothetical protein